MAGWHHRLDGHAAAAAAAAKSLQSCPTLCHPVDGSPPGPPLNPWDSPGKNTGVGCRCLNLGKLWEMVRDREAWRTAVHGAVESRIELAD